MLYFVHSQYFKSFLAQAGPGEKKNEENKVTKKDEEKANKLKDLKKAQEQLINPPKKEAAFLGRWQRNTNFNSRFSLHLNEDNTYLLRNSDDWDRNHTDIEGKFVMKNDSELELLYDMGLNIKVKIVEGQACFTNEPNGFRGLCKEGLTKNQ